MHFSEIGYSGLLGFNQPLMMMMMCVYVCVCAYIYYCMCLCIFFCGLSCYTVMFAFLAYENTQLCGDVLFCVPFFYAAYYMNFFHGVYAECVNYLTDHRLQGCLLHSDHGACPKVTLLQN